jgi:hypothetical protein
MASWIERQREIQGRPGRQINSNIDLPSGQFRINHREAPDPQLHRC